jgi:hypothetical protein
MTSTASGQLHGAQGERREDIVEGRVVCGVRVAMLVAKRAARAYDERCAELIDAFRRREPDSVTGAPGAYGFSERRRMEEPQGPDALDRSGLRGRCVGVEEDRVRELVVLDEPAREIGIARSDRHELGAPAPDLVVAVAQLRGVLAAMESAEVAQEDENDGLLRPEIAEPPGRAIGVGEREGLEVARIHTESLGHFSKTRLESPGVGCQCTEL